MHENIFRAMKKIAARKLDEAHELLRALLLLPPPQSTLEDKNYARLLTIYVHCLKKNYSDAVNECLALEENYFPIRSQLLPLIQFAEKSPQNLVSNYNNGMADNAEKIAVSQITSSEGPKILSENQWQTFFESDELWQLPFVNALTGLGFSVDVVDGKKISIPTIVAFAIENKIPFYALCQDLIRLPDFCCPLKSGSIINSSEFSILMREARQKKPIGQLSQLFSPVRNNSGPFDSPARTIQSPISSPIASSNTTKINTHSSAPSELIIMAPTDTAELYDNTFNSTSKLLKRVVSTAVTANNATPQSNKSDTNVNNTSPTVVGYSTPDKLFNGAAADGNTLKIRNYSIALKKCTQKNNRLAVLLMMMLGIVDNGNDSFECIPKVPSPAAVEIAVHFGYTHCVALLSKAAITGDCLDKAFKRAIRDAKNDCIDILLNGRISFDAKLYMYSYVKEEIEGKCPNPGNARPKNPKNAIYLDMLLKSHITLIELIKHDIVDLIKLFKAGNGAETIQDKELIINMSAEKNYACCLNETIFLGVDESVSENALMIAAKFRRPDCIRILLTKKISFTKKIAAFFEAMGCVELKTLASPGEHMPRQVLTNITQAASQVSSPNNTPRKQSIPQDTAYVNSLELILNSIEENDLEMLLMEATRKNNISALYFVCKRRNFSIDSLNRALILAVKLVDRDRIDFIMALLELYSSDSEKRKAKQTAIDKIVKAKIHDLNILFVLLGYGLNDYDVLKVLVCNNFPSKKNNSLLQNLIARGKVDSVLLLLCNDYPVNLMLSNVEKDKKSCNGTPAMVAAHYGNVTCLQVLMEKQADITIPFPQDHIFILQQENSGIEIDYSGYTALHFAANNVDCLPRILSAKHFKKSMLSLGCANGDTALHVAARANNIGCIRLLIAEGANVLATNSVGDTALHVAVRAGHDQCIELLATKNAVLAENIAGDTALHVAVRENKHTQCISALIAKNANIFAKNKTGDSAPLLAVRLCNEAAFKYFAYKDVLFNENPTSAIVEIYRGIMFQFTQLVQTPNQTKDWNSQANNVKLQLDKIQAHLQLCFKCLFSHVISWYKKSSDANAVLFVNLCADFMKTKNLICFNLLYPYMTTFFQFLIPRANADIHDEMNDIVISDKFYELIEIALANKFWAGARLLLELSMPKEINLETRLKIEKMEEKEALKEMLKAQKLDTFIKLLGFTGIRTNINCPASPVGNSTPPSRSVKR